MPKFADLAKPAADLLNDDFSASTNLKAKMKAGNFVVTTETAPKYKGDNVDILSKLSFKTLMGYGVSLDKFQLKADGTSSFDISTTEIFPNVKLLLKAQSSQKCTLESEYTNNGTYLTASADVTTLDTIAASAVTSYHLPSGLNIGSHGSYSLKKSALLSWGLGANFTHGPVFTSVKTNGVKGCDLTGSYKVNKDLTLFEATSLNFSNNLFKSITLGAVYKAPIGTVKGKVNDAGVINLSLNHVYCAKSKTVLIPSVEIDGKKGGFKYGIGITVG